MHLPHYKIINTFKKYLMINRNLNLINIQNINKIENYLSKNSEKLNYLKSKFINGKK